MKKQATTAIKMLVTLVLALVGIAYIMDKSPRSSVQDYKKTSMPKPAYSRSSGGFFSDLSSSAINGHDDNVSLMGKSGRYNEVRIGGSAKSK